MNETHLSLTATRVYAGVFLKKIFFHPIAWLIYGCILLPFVVIAAETGDWMIPVFPALIVLFPLCVLDTFLEQKFEDEEHVLDDSVALENLLAFPLVAAVRSPTTANVYDLVFAAVDTPCGVFILDELGMERETLLTRVRDVLGKNGGMDTTAFLEECRAAMVAMGRTRISASVTLSVLLHNPTFEPLLTECDMGIDELSAIFQWEWFHHHVYGKSDGFFSPQSLLKQFGGMGRSWVMGYTNELDRLTKDLSESVLWRPRRAARIHGKEIEEVIRMLGQSSSHNVLLLGKVGVGKRTLVEHFVYELRKHEQERGLPYTRVLMLRTEELLSCQDRPDAFLLTALRKAEEAGKFVLVIDQLALVLRAGGPHLRAVITKFLQTANVHVLGVASMEDYHTFVKTDPLIDSLLERVYVEDSTEEETIGVVMEHYFRIQRLSWGRGLVRSVAVAKNFLLRACGIPVQLLPKERVRVTYKAIRSIIALAQRYLGKGGFPGKAVNVLEDAIYLARKAYDPYVREEHIREVISLKTHINLSGVSQDEKKKLLGLEDTLKQEIVGQEQAVRALVSALKRARLEVNTGNKPFGTFLFLGPTGVGKTHTAKVLAREYFGSTDALVRLDMNEFSTEAGVAGIIGTTDPSATYHEGFLAQKVQERPFTLVLLDEIEKSHTKVLHLFLQVLDEGFLIDSRGVKTDFRSTIIIATSNAGALFLRDYLKNKPHVDRLELKQKLLDAVLQEKIYSPEFLNRFDEIVMYEPLTEPQTKHIAEMMIDDIIGDLKKTRGLIVEVEPDLLAEIADRGYSPEFGAREMRRVMSATIENYIADYLLNHDVKRGDKIVIRKSDIKW
ncbi:MAG: AAA family ATPase [Candidatus Peregrinibacteria bacterium]|nr:AAA family ATPase [Candidatus Peregrinibacteria bacterium]